MQAGKYMWATTAALAVASLSAAWAANANDQGKEKTAESGQQQSEAAKKQVNAKGIEASSGNMVLVGELVDTRDVTLKGVNEEKHRLLKVKPGNGPQAVIVDIGTQHPAASFGLMKGDRIIAVGKSARINDRPVLFAKSIGELYPVGRIRSMARDREQMKQDNAARARGASPAGSTGDVLTTAPKNEASVDDTGSSTAPAGNTGTMQTKNTDTKSSTASVDPPDTRAVDEVLVWFDTDNLGSDQYGPYDQDFVWITTDPAYSSWYPNATTWNDNWEKPHWDVWGYDDADELGLFDW